MQRRIFARRAARAVGGCAAFTPYAPNAAVRRAPQNRSADWQHHPAQHSRRFGGRLRVRCFGGIALQNFPEGAAVSLPLRRDGYSCRRSFFFGQLSGAVEPLAGILGALLAIRVRAALPLLLSLSGGAMVTVILAELLPECQKCPRQRLMVLATLAGFVLMMALDTMGIG